MSSELLFRDALLDESDVDLQRGTARLSFSSEAPVIRDLPQFGGKVREILSHAPGDCNLAQLNRQGIVVFNHYENFVIGSVVPGTARIYSDRKARAVVRFDKEFRRYLRWIVEGEKPNFISVGYVHLSIIKREENSNGIPTLWFAWQPNEISILTSSRQPADPTVGIGRSKPNSFMQNSFDEVLRLALSGARHRSDDLDLSGYSLGQALSDLGKDRPPRGLTREADSLRPLSIGRDTFFPKSSLFVPFGALVPMQRDLTVGTFAQGGAFVQTDVAPIISVLRSKVAAVNLGAIVFDGLEGNISFPRETAGTTPTMLGETALAAASDLKFDLPAAAPHRCTITVTVSDQLLVQSRKLESFIRQEFANSLAVKVDQLVLLGQGANEEPLGLTNLVGAGSVMYGGPATWSAVLNHENSLGVTNADVGALGFAISPATRNRWKQISRGATYPSFLIEDGECNSYPYVATNSLANTNQSIFAAWNNVMILVWSEGIFVVKDIYSLARTGQTIFTAHLYFDVLCRHEQAVCVSADSAAQ